MGYFSRFGDDDGPPAAAHDRLRTGCNEMELREFFSEDAIKLELEGDTKDDVLKELIGLLKLVA